MNTFPFNKPPITANLDFTSSPYKSKNIVKNIVEMHGGEVRAFNRSDFKNGAEIELKLPEEVTATA